MHLAHVAWHREIHQGLSTEHIFQIISACRHAATSKESTQLLSQLPASVVDPIVVDARELLFETEIAVVLESVVADVVVVVVMDVVAMAASVLVMEVVLVVVELVLVVVVPVPGSTPIQLEEPTLHDVNDAMLGPINHSSPNCPL